MHIILTSVAGVLIGTGLFQAIYGVFRKQRLTGVAMACVGITMVAFGLE